MSSKILLVLGVVFAISALGKKIYKFSVIESQCLIMFRLPAICSYLKRCGKQQLGNLLSLCREIAGARDILQKFENLKNNTSGISTYEFAFLRRRSRKLNCRENFTNISSMESIYIINILIVD